MRLVASRKFDDIDHFLFLVIFSFPLQISICANFEKKFSKKQQKTIAFEISDRAKICFSNSLNFINRFQTP